MEVDDRKRKLQGSEKRDIFKRCHKKLRGDFYATDADLVLVSKAPPGVVAYLDYKTTKDAVSFVEAILYNEWMTTAPVYIIESDDPANGPFTARRYLGADWRPEPPGVKWGEAVALADWSELEQWELKLRQEYQRRGGWNVRGGE